MEFQRSAVEVHGPCRDSDEMSMYVSVREGILMRRYIRSARESVLSSERVISEKATFVIVLNTFY